MTTAAGWIQMPCVSVWSVHEPREGAVAGKARFSVHAEDLDFNEQNIAVPV